MSEDQWDKKAEELLPGRWCTRLCKDRFEELCIGCLYPSAVAATLHEAYMQGLEDARKIVDNIEVMTEDYGIETAIQSRIDEAKKEIK